MARKVGLQSCVYFSGRQTCIKYKQHERTIEPSLWPLRQIRVIVPRPFVTGAVVYRTFSIYIYIYRWIVLSPTRKSLSWAAWYANRSSRNTYSIPTCWMISEATTLTLFSPKLLVRMQKVHLILAFHFEVCVSCKKGCRHRGDRLGDTVVFPSTSPLRWLSRSKRECV